MAQPPDEPDLAPGAANLDDAVRAGDPDRWLASRLIADPAHRADVITLLAFDLELARAPRRASNALVGEIRLTWWREVLDEIFGDRPVRRHPTALALADLIARHALARDDLEGLVEARYVELDRRQLDAGEALAWAAGAAGALARLAARVLDPAPCPAAEPAGRAWGLAQGVRADLIARDVAAPLVAAALSEHRLAPRASVSAFPAVAVGALARGLLAPKEMSQMAKRMRLVWAAAIGRC